MREAYTFVYHLLEMYVCNQKLLKHNELYIIIASAVRRII